jgi:nuclear transport factor 2 (NTF2) superfamily protein
VIPPASRLHIQPIVSGEIDLSFSGRAAIEVFLTRKWNRELDYRLIKEVWTFRENRIAVRFAYRVRTTTTRPVVAPDQ